MPSDFGGGGTLRPPGDSTQPRCVLWDRRVFPGVRQRIARWVHMHLNNGLRGMYVDAALLGRRWHPGDAQSYAEVAKAVYQCLPLNRKEGDPASRMAEDAQRVGIASLARKRDAVGTRGAQDRWVQRAAAHERDAKQPGAACRQMARGCAACMPRVWTTLTNVCGTCNGWRERKRRGTGRCRMCGSSTLCADCGGTVGCTVCDGVATAGHAGKRAPAQAVAQPHPSDSTGRAHHGSALCDDGWIPGARQRRRLGALTVGPANHTHTQWVGFAGLAQTTVERLLREGSEIVDQRASSAPHATTLASARHVHGGECSGVGGAHAATAEALRRVRCMQQRVATDGGRASSLMYQLTCAADYLAATATARAHLPDANWTAYHRVVAGDLDGPDWPIAHAGDPREQEAARRELAGHLAKGAIHVGECCGELKQGWIQAAEREVAWRERQEAGRELLRVCMRAWREVADGLPAGAAKWEMQWRRGVDCQLARRLVITQAALARWDEEWHPVRRLLTWMRLIRASHVRRARGRSDTWRQAQTAWREQRYYHGQPQAVQHTPRDTRATERQGRRDTRQLTRHTHLARSHVMPAASSSDAPPSHQPHHEEDAAAEHGDNTGVAAAPRVLGGAPPPPSTRCTHLPHAAAGDDRTPDGGGNGAGQAAAAEDSEVEGSGSSDDGGDSSGGVERSAPTAVSRPRRRRTDKPLVLTPSAREALRQRLGGGDTRSVHARRKRGDG